MIASWRCSGATSSRILAESRLSRFDIMVDDEAEEVPDNAEGSEEGDENRAQCVLCEIGGFIPEQRGCMPSSNGTIRSIMRQYAQSWKQMPDAKRYCQFADAFNARLADPAIASGFSQSHPHMRRIDADAVRKHFCEHAKETDREVLNSHLVKLDALYTHLWDKQIMAEDTDGNIALNASNVKLMLDVHKTWLHGASAERDWRTQDRTELAGVAASDEADAIGMLGGDRARIGPRLPPRALEGMDFYL